nr:hypothetical protein [Tanacetum cinerariifolium]
MELIPPPILLLEASPLLHVEATPLSIIHYHVPQDYNVSSAVQCLFIHFSYIISLSLYPFTERYAQPYFFSCLIRQMVNTRTDADLSAAVQNALQTLLPQIRAEIREEFRTSSGPSDSGGNPSPERLKMEYHSIRQTDTETSTEFMQRFFRLAGFLGAAAGERRLGLSQAKKGDKNRVLGLGGLGGK